MLSRVVERELILDCRDVVSVREENGKGEKSLWVEHKKATN